MQFLDHKKAKKIRAELMYMKYEYIGLSLRKLVLRLLLDIVISGLMYSRRPYTFHKNRIKLKKFRGQGRRNIAFVFATGPSLLKLDVNKVRIELESGAHLFVLNNYWATHLASECIPTHYILADPVYLGNIDNHFKPIDHYLKKHPEIQVWVPTGKHLCEDLRGRAPLYFDGRTKMGWTNNVKPDRPMGVSSITGHYALGLAILMEYDEIYISGFDSTTYRFIRRSQDNLFYIDGDYHAHPNITANRQMFAYESTESMLEDAARGFHDFSLFARYKLYNLDPDSLISSIPNAVYKKDLLMGENKND
jgi:hypothetical protein